MATPTQYTFDLTEATKALIKEQGIHEGKWVIAFEFTFGAGVFGATPADVAPGGFMQIRRALLSQAGEPPPPAHLIVDAAEVNPRVAEAPKRRADKKTTG
jgi:hypothetical protein